MELIKIAQVMWGIWFTRNKRIFENKNMIPEAAMVWSKKQILDWQAANKRSPDAVVDNSSIKLNQRRWQPLEAGSFKINIDAAIVVGQNSFSVGMDLRNHLGQYDSGKVMKKAGAFSVLEAELIGIIEALLWARDTVSGKVVVESDSLLSIQTVQQGQENLFEVGDLVQQCREILRYNQRLSISFVRNIANKVAPNMARVPCELNSFRFFPSPPELLLGTILSEI
ncbi:uncharacterized protein LOC141686901 [Apium graveolens]|uniref:uncharacterized protein LOC141686901 n=1 Tax=Apium graveolens TaxID=4045 RepID=UPI003D7A827C